MTPAITIVVLAVGGALLGFVAERLSVRWPAHEGDKQPRGLDWRTLVMTLLSAVVFGGLAARWHADPTALASLSAVAAMLIVLLATDLDQKLLPDLITVPLIGFTGALLLLGLSPLLAGSELGLPSGIAAGVAAPLFLFVTDRLIGGDLGDGDLKLALSVGLITGLSLLVGGLLVASIGFSAVLLVLIAARRINLNSAVPFGPALIATAFVAMLTG